MIFPQNIHTPIQEKTHIGHLETTDAVIDSYVEVVGKFVLFLQSLFVEFVSLAVVAVAYSGRDDVQLLL